MKILIDIGHPAHVHLFKNFIKESQSRNFEIITTVKDIPEAKKLLNNYSIPYIEIGDKSDSIKGKFFNQLKFNYRLLRLVNEKKINLGIGTSLTIAHVSRISKLKSIILDDDDDDVQPLFTKFAHPFCDVLISPISLNGRRKKKGTVYYYGFHELAYLHPKRFIPNPQVLEETNITSGEMFFVLRFNSFKAHHDYRVEGISFGNKRKLINLLLKYGKVFITSEREIEDEFEQYQIKLSPEKIHHLLYFSTMFLGDSQTMTSEAAILGTPALKCNSFAGKLSVPNELEKEYALCYAFNPNQFKLMLEKIVELLSINDLKAEWQRRRIKMLEDKIDVTAFMVWFVKNYPDSVRIMKENPEYQFNFK